MKILVVTTYYWPEQFKITDLVSGLKSLGHDMEVLTALPNYPAGRFFDGYGLGGPYRQEHQGVRISRVPIVPRGSGGALRLALNYVSFPISGAIRAIALGRKGWDIIFVMQLSPVTVLLPAVLVRAIYRIPVVIWSQDLWPESIASAGFAKSRFIYALVRAMSGWLYRRCDRILASSRTFLPKLEALGVRSDRLGYLPQWADVLPSTMHEELVPSVEGAWTEGFPVMFAGNLGRVQALDTILAAAELLREDPTVRWVFLGDGTQREWLAGQVVQRGLGDRVFLLGRRPVEEMPAYYAKAAAMLVSLKPDDTMALTVPAKIQSCLASGRPIIASLDGEGARVVHESGGGWVAPAGDAAALAALVSKMKALAPGLREEMGQRGKAYSDEHFTRATCLKQLELALAETLASREREGLLLKARSKQP